MLNTFTGRIQNGLSQALSKVLSGKQPTSSNADSLSHAVVLNSNDDAAGTELIGLLVSTIFNNQTGLIERMLPATIAQAAGRNISEVEALLERLIDQELAAKRPDARLMQQLLSEHQARTEANKRAYLTEGRANPDAVFWPNPANKQSPRSLRTELPFVKKTTLIDRNTAIVSMGSCFAVEIAHALQRDGYNYIVKEPNVAPDGTYWFKDHETKEYPASSAAWGTHFNCPSFRQLVEKAFGYRRPAKILWNNMSNGQVVFCDPFREEVEFPSVVAFENNYDKHIAAARAALSEAQIIIITLGLNEVWYFKPDGSVFSRSPWRTAPSLVEHRVLSVDENVRDLQRMLDVLRKHNPRVKLIVTLSPIPLHATFLGDTKHIVDANAHSKAVLRVAAEEFVRSNNDVYYFPSYELITTCLENPWSPDERHVTRATVEKVMTMFRQMFCSEP